MVLELNSIKELQLDLGVHRELYSFLFLLGLIIMVSSLAETGGINLFSKFKNIQELILITFIVFIFSLDLSLLGGYTMMRL